MTAPQCTTPGCDRPIEYKRAGKCRRCYQRQWYQVNVMGRRTEATRIELAAKAICEKAIFELRDGEDQIQSGELYIKHKVKVPRSDYTVSVIIQEG